MLSAISALEIEEKEDGMMKEYKYGDQKYALVQDVLGMTPKEAVKVLKQFKVEFSGSGEKITYQSPKAGSIINEGEIIRLMLSE